MSQDLSNLAPTAMDWDNIANRFFDFAKEKPYVACYLFTVCCVAAVVYAVKTHPPTKAEAIVASN